VLGARLANDYTAGIFNNPGVDDSDAIAEVSHAARAFDDCVDRFPVAPWTQGLRLPRKAERGFRALGIGPGAHRGVGLPPRGRSLHRLCEAFHAVFAVALEIRSNAKERTRGMAQSPFDALAALDCRLDEDRSGAEQVTPRTLGKRALDRSEHDR
jgi:hypothetical protein